MASRQNRRPLRHDREPAGRKRRIQKRENQPQGTEPGNKPSQRDELEKRIFNRPNMPRILRRGNVFFIMPIDSRGFYIPWLKVITVLLIFFGGMMIALTYAHLSNTRGQILVARRDLLAYQEANSSMRSQIFDRHTADEIERIARERLGMEFPDPSQIFEIYVTPRDTVVLNTAVYVLPQENYFWQGITNFVSGLVNRVFRRD